MEDTESQELDVSALNLQPDENVNEPNKFVDSSEDSITTQQQNNTTECAKNPTSTAQTSTFMQLRSGKEIAGAKEVEWSGIPHKKGPRSIHSTTSRRTFRSRNDSGGSTIASSAGKLNVKAELVAAQIKRDRERKTAEAKRVSQQKELALREDEIRLKEEMQLNELRVKEELQRNELRVKEELQRNELEMKTKLQRSELKLLAHKQQSELEQEIIEKELEAEETVAYFKACMDDDVTSKVPEFEQTNTTDDTMNTYSSLPVMTPESYLVPPVNPRTVSFRTAPVSAMVCSQTMPSYSQNASGVMSSHPVTVTNPVTTVTYTSNVTVPIVSVLPPYPSTYITNQTATHPTTSVDVNSSVIRTEESKDDIHTGTDPLPIHTDTLQSTPFLSATRACKFETTDTTDYIPRSGTTVRTASKPVVPSQPEYIIQMPSIQGPTMLPRPYQGDSYTKYYSWKTTFQAATGRARMTLEDKVSLLQNSLEGDALESVQGFLMFPSEDAYEEALHRLDERYGNPLALGAEFRRRLESWPVIPKQDMGRNLRQLSDFLQQLISAQRAYRNLVTYMGDFEFSRIISKLPSFLQTRWIRASYLSAQKGIRVGLQEFVDFIMMESDILCNGSYDYTSNTSRHSPTDKPHRLHVHSTNSTTADNTDNSRQVTKPCYVCTQLHAVYKCPTFAQRSLDDRYKIVSSNKACFKCLRTGHFMRDCKLVLSSCKLCNKSHNELLHDHTQKGIGQNVNRAYSNVSQTYSASPANSNEQLEEEEDEH